MNASLAGIAARVNALETKERVLISIALALLAAMLWVKFGFDPLTAERRALQARISATQNRVAEANILAAQIIEAAQRDPNIRVREQLALTAARLEQSEAEIRERVGQLIPPQQMPLLLRSVLEQIRGLEFVGLRGLGAEPLIEPAADGKTQSADTAATGLAANAFRHGFRISFKGSYLDTLAYLQALEALPWRFFWDSVDIEVQAHPEASVSIVVYTLSLDRSWIGV